MDLQCIIYIELVMGGLGIFALVIDSIDTVM